MGRGLPLIHLDQVVKGRRHDVEDSAAFISYSHAVDGALRRRSRRPSNALRSHGTSGAPCMCSTIERPVGEPGPVVDAQNILSDTEYSSARAPESAASEWVNHEVDSGCVRARVTAADRLDRRRDR